MKKLSRGPPFWLKGSPQYIPLTNRYPAGRGPGRVYVWAIPKFSGHGHKNTGLFERRIKLPTLYPVNAIRWIALTLLAESLQSFLDKSGKRKRLPLPDLSRKIEGDSVRKVDSAIRRLNNPQDFFRGSTSTYFRHSQGVSLSVLEVS